ncbi:MAG: class I SAM-dependent methyltransferase [Anaeroplasmataceae bacterium]
MQNNHYYSNDQSNLKSKKDSFEYLFKGNRFIFTTDNGVFSKKFIDYGTQVMLENFIPNNLELPILDIGCGYGPIGLVISKVYNKFAYMVDINSRAIDLAKDNAKTNKCDDVNIFISNSTDMIEASQKFSSIICNPPIRTGKTNIYKIYQDAFDKLTNGGEFWIVIQKKQGAPSSINKLIEIFDNCSTVKKDKGYYILKSIKNNLNLE